MSSKSFFDSDVLLEAHSKKPSSQRSACKGCVERAWQDRSGVISTSVLRDFYDGLRSGQATLYTASEARVCIEDYLSWHVVVDDVMTLIDAIAMDELEGISANDALVVQAALVGGASTIYSYRVPENFGDTPVRVLRPSDKDTR